MESSLQIFSKFCSHPKIFQIEHLASYCKNLKDSQGQHLHATCSETKRQQYMLVLSYLSKSLVIYTRYSYITLDSFCNTCNKPVSYGNSIEYNLCLTQTHISVPIKILLMAKL